MLNASEISPIIVDVPFEAIARMGMKMKPLKNSANRIFARYKAM
jgi:hypothetical protein